MISAMATMPGCTALTRPVSPRIERRGLGHARDREFGSDIGEGNRRANQFRHELVLMIEPPPRSRIVTSTASIPKKTDIWLISTMRRYSFSVHLRVARRRRVRRC